MTDKPRLYLDLDGTITVIPAQHGNPEDLPHLECWEVWDEFTCQDNDKEYRILYSPTLIEEVKGLSSVFDIRILSDWRHTALTQFAPNTGLPEFPVVTAVGVDSPSSTLSSLSGPKERRWWKVNAIAEDMEGSPNLKWAWVDDAVRGSVRTYFKSLSTAKAPNLILTPFQSMGMTPWHVEQLYNFAK